MAVQLPSTYLSGSRLASLTASLPGFKTRSSATQCLSPSAFTYLLQCCVAGLSFSNIHAHPTKIKQRTSMQQHAQILQNMPHKTSSFLRHIQGQKSQPLTIVENFLNATATTTTTTTTSTATTTTVSTLRPLLLLLLLSLLLLVLLLCIRFHQYFHHLQEGGFPAPPRGSCVPLDAHFQP